ncbi:LysR substrate-binding domain-containing protein [Methylocella sp. CPCC 101449]|uniref:LysR family transcriptional regulator n=1 Tax=Methylocella sp. CPCC 101449 TaxID=2987531 RepID=UPI0028909160|nr:LysR substrate-binding domain-containing protein [Methylocella sp. CPCC 101449]MDT2022148.1 LysR substrate-binding domain-containing protein [Methylocella sp. CPCC 101449]
MRHVRIWQYVDEAARCGSIRRAAERLNITPSALQRRIQDVEEDLGAEVFERLPSGVKLTAAGEMLIHWIRSQSAALQHARSQIEDLSGLRRGSVRIACSQALAVSFLPAEIEKFNAVYPLVRFSAVVNDHGGAITALRDYEADLALVFQPERHNDFQPLMSVGQRLMAIFASGHPLAQKETIRLRDCTAYPLALADRSFSGRRIMESILASVSTRFDVQLESNSFELLRNYVRRTQAVMLQIELGALEDLPDSGLIARPIDDRDLAHGSLVLGQLKGRTLPVAVAKFADQIAHRMDQLRTLPTI